MITTKNRRRRYGLLLVAMAGAAPVIAADSPIAPEQIPGVTRIDAEGLLRLVDQERRLVIVDARIAADRRQGYIEGSVSLPDTETSCPSLARVLPARNHPALFYCNGVRCGRSVVALRIALKCGYTRLYWYRGGFEDWKAKGYPYLKQ